MSQWRELTKLERSRTYYFPSDADTEALEAVTIENVDRLRVSPTGTHYIETAKGTKLIVKNTWLVLKIDADEWSF